MDQISIKAFDPDTRIALFRALNIDPAQLTDLGGFESFVFAREDRQSILRVTHQSHRSLEQVLAELDWIDYLARHGAAVCTPLPLSDGAMAKSWQDFVVCEFSRAGGHEIGESDWTPALFESWGRSIAMFHDLSMRYEPPAGKVRRPDCSADENFDLIGLVPADEPHVLARARDYRNRFMSQPRTAGHFGLIHSDPHGGNFLLHEGKLTFFDFDDACYCWFAYDIATILLSVVMNPWIEDSRTAREQAAREFLPAFLDGYSAIREVSPSMTASLPLCLKFREICLYGVISAFVPRSERHQYESRFMTGRRDNIESDAPYLALNFL